MNGSFFILGWVGVGAGKSIPILFDVTLLRLVLNGLVGLLETRSKFLELKRLSS